MGEFINLPFTWKTAKSGEEISDRLLKWIISTKAKLLKSFPPGERAFCRIFHGLLSRLPGRRWRMRMWYTRQKHFLVTPEIVFFGDFYFKNMKLLVEIDGDSHTGKQAKDKDEWRSKLITAWKVRTIRFTNDEVLNGDFRDVEFKFITEVGKLLPFAVRRKLSIAYYKAKQRNPHIYG